MTASEQTLLNDGQSPDHPALDTTSRITHHASRLASIAEAVNDCRRCQMAGYLPLAEPRLLGLARVLNRDLAPAGGLPRLMVVGQSPSRHAGRYIAEPLLSPFVSTLGRWLTQAGFSADDLLARVHFSALTRCFPGASRDGKGDRAPSRAEIALCADHLAAETALLRPAVVLPVGKLAIDALYGRPRSLTEAVGTSWERDGVHYLPLPHPSGVSRWRNDPANQARVDRALALLAAWRVELGL
jgi:uracil-DNA glycosylase